MPCNTLVQNVEKGKKKSIVLPKDLSHFLILYFSRVNAQEFSYMHR